MSNNAFWNGEVVGIYIASTADAPMESLQEARLVEGKGIEGDRYYAGTGTHSDEECYEVTLIESETVEAMQREYRLECDASEPRRNIVTRGFALNHLVNREFQIGEIRLRGLALREPCAHLMEVTSHKMAIGLMHRGGLGAQVISSGIIHVGDPICDA